MPRAEPVLVAQGVSRRYGHRRVLHDVTLEIFQGQVILLIGPNGAGKTTLLRVLAGLLRPSAGRVERRGSVSMVAHHSMLYDVLTARENLRFYGRLHRVGASRAEELLQQLGLAARADERVAAYSRGMTQRAAIARALLPDPDLLLLDEPLTGLDDASCRVVLDVLSDLRDRGRAMAIASHQVAELMELVTAVGFLKDGRLLALEPAAGRGTDEVLARYRSLLVRG
ncbi:MAG TPA: ATP-binding cassette domain-containing protein [Gemmatimonadales bacterium]|nr:ATP-binding cassette domain-containing protein [Gemmatimonadales bacterium]